MPGRRGSSIFPLGKGGGGRLKRKKKRTSGERSLRLSLCMIVKNEEENLPRCLEPLRAVLDECIVVDTGSTDRTKEVAAGLGAKVFDFPWRDDFSAARNESLRRATADYLLWLDADDRVDPAEVCKLAQLKKMLPPRKNRAFYLVVKNQSPVDGETPFYQMRIFPRLPGVFFEGRVHEQIFHRLPRLGIQLVQTEITIRHTGYPDAAAVMRKSERNLRIIREELALAPENPLLHYNAARTLAGIGRQAEAIGHLKKVTGSREIREKEKPFFLEASLLLGKYHTEVGELAEAGRIFGELAREFPAHGLLHFALGEVLFLQKNFPQARKELETSLRYPVEVSLFPVNLKKLQFYQHYNLGECLLETGEPAAARDFFLKSLGLHADDHKSWQALGLMALKEGQFQEAARCYEKAIAGGGAGDGNCANLGLAYRKLGRRAEAEEVLLRSLRLNPRRREALVHLGHLYHEEKKYAPSLACFSRALELDPRQIDVRLLLSDLYFRLERAEELVAQCDALRQELGLHRRLVLNNVEQLGAHFMETADALAAQGRRDLASLADRVAFLIAPGAELLQKMISRAAACGRLQLCLEGISEVLSFHGQDSPGPPAHLPR